MTELRPGWEQYVKGGERGVSEPTATDTTHECPGPDLEALKYGPGDYTTTEMLAWLNSDTCVIQGTDMAVALIAALERIPELEQERSALRSRAEAAETDLEQREPALAEARERAEGLTAELGRMKGLHAQALAERDEEIERQATRAARVEAAARAMLRQRFARPAVADAAATALRAALAAAPSVDAEAYHTPLAAAFRDRRKVAEETEGDFEPDALGDAPEDDAAAEFSDEREIGRQRLVDERKRAAAPEGSDG